jgi:anaerobic selenocysteine-containing dehydrogenase
MSIERPSVCPLDCPDTCSLSVTVDGDRVVRVRGSDANPLTGGVLCNKVTHFYPDFVHGENRVRYPRKRIGPKGEGKFARITWEEALDTIHGRFSEVIERYGPQSVLPLNYAGPHGMLAGGSMDLRFFHRLGATQLHRRAMCGGVKGEAYAGTFGAMPGMRPEQVANARLVVVWGNNVTYSNLHLMPLINRARRANGARVVVIDPKRIKVAEQADMHLALRPGTDVVLAFAVACELERTGGLDRGFIDAHVAGFDAFMARARAFPADVAAGICGLTADDIRSFAALYRETDPAIIAVGNGLERNRNGGSAVRAVLALPALAGKFGVPGSGAVAGAGNAFPKTPSRLARPDLAPAGTRTLNILDVGRHLADDDLDPPIRAVFIYNHNPVIVHPDQNRMKRALARDEIFTVGCDVAMTDSLAYADIVLPACTHFEHADLFPAYGHHHLQRAEAVISPVGESLPNTEIFRRLAARFGFDEAAFRASDAELMDDAMDPADARLGGRAPSRLPLGAAVSMEFAGEEAIPFSNVFPKTASGRVELDSVYLAKAWNAPLPTFVPLEDPFPLWLVTPSSDRRITSTFGGLKWSEATPVLEMHPDDAAARGLADGQRVRVWNGLGEVRLPLTVTDAVRPGVVYSDKGAWFRTSDNGQTVSALAPTTKSDLCAGACYNDTRVEVAALG